MRRWSPAPSGKAGVGIVVSIVGVDVSRADGSCENTCGSVAFVEGGIWIVDVVRLRLRVESHPLFNSNADAIDVSFCQSGLWL